MVVNRHAPLLKSAKAPWHHQDRSLQQAACISYGLQSDWAWLYCNQSDIHFTHAIENENISAGTASPFSSRSAMTRNANAWA